MYDVNRLVKEPFNIVDSFIRTWYLENICLPTSYPFEDKKAP